MKFLTRREIKGENWGSVLARWVKLNPRIFKIESDANTTSLLTVVRIRDQIPHAYNITICP